MQNQPGSDWVLADCVRFWPNGSVGFWLTVSGLGQIDLVRFWPNGSGWFLADCVRFGPNESGWFLADCVRFGPNRSGQILAKWIWLVSG